MLKACSCCGEEKPLDAFYKHPFGKLGRMGKCAECTKEAVRANRLARIEYYRAYERERARLPHRIEARAEYLATKQQKPRPERDPAKLAARRKLGNAIRDGHVIRPPNCEVCSAPGDVHGHHDDYSKPLDVIWCCIECHALIHAYWRAQDRKAA